MYQYRAGAWYAVPLHTLLSALLPLLLAACATASPPSLDAQLASLIEESGVTPYDPGPPQDPALVELGEVLFWDPILSGNRDTACATCHHSNLATGDALSVSVGTGTSGLGPDRPLGEGRILVPRNATEIFNRGAPEWQTMFWDGRIEGRTSPGFVNPASYALPTNLDNILAAQAMFPVTSRDEMRGDLGDRDIFDERNELAGIRNSDVELIWSGLMDRLRIIPEYVDLFAAAYPVLPTEELGFEHAANAIAAYEIAAFTFTDSPWDQYVYGDLSALSDQQKRGAVLFFGEAGCANCHNGPLLTDQDYYNLHVPQVGPGKDPEEPIDTGRFRESGAECDKFAFRTPPLRNVALTGPYMHNGAYTTLEGAVRHHLDPRSALLNFNASQLSPSLQETVQTNPLLLAALLTVCEPLDEPITLTDAQMADLMVFLDSLTAPAALDLSHTVPSSVPSGLEVGGLGTNLP